MTFFPIQPSDLPRIRSRGLPRCRGCGLPEVMCLCAELPRLAPRTRVVLITHRIERTKSTNTGRLVAAMLEGAEIRERGAIEPRERSPLPEGRRLVLFPAPEARELTPDDARGEPLILLVPDGNWSQARRAFRREIDARGASVVRLPEGAPSRYGLRRSPREGTLSTLEAVARALGVLEGASIEEPMMAAFDRWVERARHLRLTGTPTIAEPRVEEEPDEGEGPTLGRG